MALTREQQIAALEKDWAENPRWKGVTALTPLLTSSACVARFNLSTPLQKWAPRSCGTW
jgi:hypothetical protein